MPLQQTSGNVTADAYGGGVAAVPNYIEDVFSTYLYTGSGSNRTIVNGIDLAGKGGLVWIKNRTTAGNSNVLADTVRGSGQQLFSDTTAAQTYMGLNPSFASNGFGLATNATNLNATSNNYTSWTFRKQPKFFDVVTHSSGSSLVLNHSLGSVPGFVLIKSTGTTGAWYAFHTSINGYLQLQTTGAAVNTSRPSIGSNIATSWVAATSTTIDCSNIQSSTDQFVVYLFAHNAGGFGLTGTDNVITCGSYTLDASGNADVNLGFEPQLIISKRFDAAASWLIMDTMRGLSLGGTAGLIPNTSGAEFTYGANVIYPTATGFSMRGWGSAGSQEIFIAIRRGPMKVPTDGTKVFAPVTATPSGTTTVTTNFPVDLAINTQRNKSVVTNTLVFDRLRGSSTTSSNYLFTDSTGAENASATFGMGLQSNTAMLDAVYNPVFGVTTPVAYWNFRRAPGFFDEVCYTGTGGLSQTISHNLGVVPELAIIKTRNYGTAPFANWLVGSVYLPTGTPTLYLQSPIQAQTGSYLQPNWSSGATATTINLSANICKAYDYVAYLFASCPGVSKVFTFTGNGTTQTINCGFTGGARFVLLKASSAVGSWYVYDTARGMTTLTDPYLFLNSTAAETATLGSVTTVTGGFAVNEAITTGVNTNAVQYIGIAIA